MDDTLPFFDEPSDGSTSNSQASCPICGLRIKSSDPVLINLHIDECLANSLSKELPKQDYSVKSHKSQSHSVCSSCAAVDGHLTTCPLYKLNPKPKAPPPKTSYYSPSDAYSHNPFTVTCPYPSCGINFPAKEFAVHVVNLHNSGPQAYACPVCPLLGYTGYVVKKDTNLLTHIQNIHPDLLAESFSTFSKPSDYHDFEGEDDFVYNPEDFVDVVPHLEIAKKAATNYIDDVIKEHKPGVECSICYEEFTKGAAIVRMECLCIFHKTCITNWFQKSKHCPLHKE